ncbi:MAG: hypothetical protein GWN67_13775 [Phycisphaerae bacterium]|nr:hypothetical protein [Phycisphaerae bacterium]NIV10565.1 hypothetical protein [Fodinibius sp.]NIP53180.1 hypothetical protein [Phycisphaerae bacterium]NIS52214.1 hypothetical protein [Phycisphaerae bacterium]NIU09738.1 hypothetical protein [Phycisphaerae bacterium]
MSETKGFLKQLSEKRYRVLFWAVVAAVFIYLIARNIGAFGNILLVVLGFGMVVLVHEFGHFIVAKLSGVKVEAFSIGFPPALFGIQRTESGYRVRLFPKFSEKEGEVEDDRVIFTLGKEGKASDTEYRIGLIPAGGFVKMLGQDDIGPVKNSDDPRSYANKPVLSRMAILAAGVICNVISAMLIFMIVFLIGIKLPPAVIGGVKPDSPAAHVGLKPRDEVIEINGKRGNLDFINIQVAAALSGRDEEVHLKVKRGEEFLDFSIVAEETETLGGKMRLFGITQAMSLKIAKLTEEDEIHLREKTGFVPNDRIKSVNGIEVQNHWELMDIVENSLVPEVTLTAERKDKEGRVKLIDSKLKLELVSEGTGHIYSMVPRMRMERVRVKKSSGSKGTARSQGVREKGSNLDEDNAKAVLQSGDIILGIGKVLCPTYKEFREVITKHEDKELSIKVLRTDVSGTEKPVEISVTPTRHKDVNEVLIGIEFFGRYDTAHAVVAKTISVKGGPEELNIPDGAKITAVDGTPVSNFYDVIREIRRYPGERITIDWRVDEQVAGSVAFNVDPNMRGISVKSVFADYVPFDDMKRLYRAGNPIEAVGMGYEKTIMFIKQTYLTLRRLVGRDVSPKNLMGPVGIFAVSYRAVAERPFIYYVYFLGLISACIAVVNFLPLPPLDGGLVVLLVVEKIKGSALSEKTQGIIAYAGWVLIGAFFLYVTFNDIVRTFFGGL